MFNVKILKLANGFLEFLGHQ